MKRVYCCSHKHCQQLYFAKIKNQTFLEHWFGRADKEKVLAFFSQHLPVHLFSKRKELSDGSHLRSLIGSQQEWAVLVSVLESFGLEPKLNIPAQLVKEFAQGCQAQDQLISKCSCISHVIQTPECRSITELLV